MTIPQMTVFPNLELQPMGIHVQSDGSQIGGIDPAHYGTIVPPGADKCLILYQSGNTDPTKKAYPAMEVYPLTPITIPPNTGNLKLAYDMTVDASTVANANVIETDLIVIAGGMKYNLSGERRVQTGQIDVGALAAGWTDSGVRAGLLAADKPHHVEYTYAFDVAAKTCQTTSYACDENVWPIPATTQIKAEPSTWTNGIILLQIQFGNFPAGLPIVLKIQNCKLYVW